MMRRMWIGAVLSGLLVGCGGGSTIAPDSCDPREGTVVEVIDGDTIDVESAGEVTRVRYILVDAPETSASGESECYPQGDGRPAGADSECFGEEARQLNEMLVLGQKVSLKYEPDSCRDMFGRALAYVSLGDRMINRILLERGYACLFVVGGSDASYTHEAEFTNIAQQAQDERSGLWGVCK